MFIVTDLVSLTEVNRVERSNPKERNNKTKKENMTNRRSKINLWYKVQERKNERKKGEKERMKYHEYTISTSKRKQLSIPQNRNCLGQLHEIQWNHTMGVHRGSIPLNIYEVWPRPFLGGSSLE